jgi:hypothetical protein
MDQSLSESDARTICHHLTTHLVQMGGQVTAIGVHLDAEGFWFSAVIHGTQVWVRRGQGSWAYRDVAVDLLRSALERRLAQFEDLPTDGRAPLTATPQESHGQRETGTEHHPSA